MSAELDETVEHDVCTIDCSRYVARKMAASDGRSRRPRATAASVTFHRLQTQISDGSVNIADIIGVVIIFIVDLQLHGHVIIMIFIRLHRTVISDERNNNILYNYAVK